MSHPPGLSEAGMDNPHLGASGQRAARWADIIDTPYMQGVEQMRIIVTISRFAAISSKNGLRNEIFGNLIEQETRRI